MRKIFEMTMVDGSGNRWDVEGIVSQNFITGGQAPDGAYEQIEERNVYGIRYWRFVDGVEHRLSSLGTYDAPDIFEQKEIDRMEGYAKSYFDEPIVHPWDAQGIDEDAVYDSWSDSRL